MFNLFNFRVVEIRKIYDVISQRKLKIVLVYKIVSWYKVNGTVQKICKEEVLFLVDFIKIVFLLI